MSAGSLLVDIGMNIARLQSDVGKATSIFASGMKKISNDVDFLKNSLVGLVSVGSLVALGHSALQLGDDLSKASKKFGMATEDLSALRYAASLADVPFDGLQTALGKLSQAMTKGAEKGSDMSYAFRAMGIDIKSYKGNVTEALVDISRKFQEFEKGAGAVDLAKAIFGKTGANMIPLMEDVAKGFSSMRTEAAKFGALMTDEQAKQMERYNDNLKKIKMSMEGVAVNTINMGADALAWLFRMNDISERLVGNLNKIAAKVGDKISGGGTSGEIRYKAPPPPILAKAPDEEAQKFKDKADELRKSLATIISPEHFEEMVKASGRDYAKLETMAKEYSSNYVKRKAEEGKVTHDALMEEMGLTADYYSTAEKSATDLYNIEEKQASDKLDWQRELSKEKDEALRQEEALAGYTPPYTAEDAMRAATAYGNVALSIQTMNSELGTQYALTEEGKSYVALYQQAWLDANLAIADSMKSLYSGMQGWISSSLQGLIEGTMQVQDVLKNLGKMMLSIITEYVAKWLVSRLFMAAMGKTFAAAEIAAAMVTGPAVALAWAPAAAMVEIATLGGASIAAAAGLAETVALATLLAVPKLAEGGIVDRPTLALVGESGPEAIVPLGKGGGITQLILDGRVLAEWHADAMRSGMIRMVPA